MHGFQPVLPIDVQLDSVQLPAVHDFVAVLSNDQNMFKLLDFNLVRTFVHCAAHAQLKNNSKFVFLSNITL